LAIAYLRGGRRLEAVAAFEQAATLEPTVDRLMDLAAAYGFAARMPDARRTYERVLAASPERTVAMYNLANVVFLEGDLERAAELYQRALAVEPDYLLATFQLAVTFKHREQFKEAYQTFGRVLDLEPKTPDELQAYHNALYEMAALDIAMGAHQRAEEMLRALIEASPEHPNAHYALGQVLLRAGRIEEAQRELLAHQEIRSRVPPAGQVASAQ
jgi:superkiller protein 3